MAAEGGVIRQLLNMHLGNDIEPVWDTYTGQEEISREVTHVIVNAEFIPEEAFYEHPNIVAVICRKNVKKIEQFAFNACNNLRHIIMPGVKIVGEYAFSHCSNLTYVECGKLEIIGEKSLNGCNSLRSIKLPSARIVEHEAFTTCTELTEVKFGSKLERIEGAVFDECHSLERITIPLKDNLLTEDDIFWECEQLKQVVLVEEAVLQETVATLHMDGWKNDLKKEIDSINKILPTTPAGEFDGDVGEKARVIGWWISAVLRKVNHYKAEHQRVLDEAASTLQLCVPRDIVMNNVIPFLALPPHTSEVEEQEVEENDGVDEEMQEEDQWEGEGDGLAICFAH